MTEKIKNDNLELEKGDVFHCFYCHRAISEYHTKCPFCSASLVMPDSGTLKDTAAAARLSLQTSYPCPTCGKPVPVGSKTCPTCDSVQESGDFQRIKMVVHSSASEGIEANTHMKLFLFASEGGGSDPQNREKLFFPPACITSSLYTLEPHLSAGIRKIPEETAPKAVISADNGQSCYYLVAGPKMTLGRQTDVCHVPAILFPENDYRDQNSNVSRKHCQIFIKQQRVYIKDMSRNGTSLFSKQIHFNRQVGLAHQDQIMISDVLDLGVQIFTAGQDIIAVMLRRLNNTTGERYILTPGYIPFGRNPSFPICLSEGPANCGAFYYNTELQSWCVKFPSDEEQTLSEKVLDSVTEISFGSNSLWFTVLK
ncbi:FHA domain-containing protein [candidate division CSSED10-310 bacterium]|uniref:FHA domain-containing protein n=1 Tax=candidate division CSSED10-310 bacterium TaxID=2855610 RepID=A0ABV6Z1I0_UNCC1